MLQSDGQTDIISVANLADFDAALMRLHRSQKFQAFLQNFGNSQADTAKAILAQLILAAPRSLSCAWMTLTAEAGPPIFHSIKVGLEG